MIKQVIFFAALFLFSSIAIAQDTTASVDITDVQLLENNVLCVTVQLSAEVSAGLSVDLRVALKNTATAEVAFSTKTKIEFTGAANELRTVFLQLDADIFANVTLRGSLSLRNLKIGGTGVDVNVDISSTEAFKVVNGLIKGNILADLDGIISVSNILVSAENTLMEVQFQLNAAVEAAVDATAEITARVGNSAVATFLKDLSFDGLTAGQTVTVVVDVSSINLETSGVYFDISLLNISTTADVDISLVADVVVDITSGVLVAVQNVLTPIEQVLFPVLGAVDSTLVQIEELALAGSKTGLGAPTYLRVYLNVSNTLQVGAKVDVNLDISILNLLTVSLVKTVHLELEAGEEVVARFDISSVVSTLLGVLSGVANITVSLSGAALDVNLDDLTVELGLDVAASLSVNASGLLTLNL